MDAPSQSTALQLTDDERSALRTEGLTVARAAYGRLRAIVDAKEEAFFLQDKPDSQPPLEFLETIADDRALVALAIETVITEMITEIYTLAAMDPEAAMILPILRAFIEKGEVPATS